MRRRDRRALSADQRVLAERYIPLVRSLARPFKSCWPRMSHEFESAAMVALVEAAEAFDPTRDVKFGTYARRRIWGALCDARRTERALGYRGDPVNAPSVVGLPLGPEAKGRVLGADRDDPVGSAMEESEEIEAILRKLPAGHALAIRQIYVHGKTQAEAAEVVGCSQSRLSYMCREAMAILNGSWAASVLEGR